MRSHFSYVLLIYSYSLLYGIIVQNRQEIIGFRYLLSAAVADILCMVQYAGLNGIAILTKRRLVSVEARPRMQVIPIIQV